jgi:hypothetical protein
VSPSAAPRPTLHGAFASEEVRVFEVPATLTDATPGMTTPGFTCTNGGTTYAYTANGPATVEMALAQD